ncbi:MAG: hypothetical protein KAJ10_16335, partial [Thermodesulfovibrionia bacterium]|nr:hypothetical protein [Thermodesulfovibrionia bacterium]
VTASDYVGTWYSGYWELDEIHEYTLTLDSKLRGTLVTTRTDRTDTYIISATFAGGDIGFVLPLSDLDDGNPDCSNWEVDCYAFMYEHGTDIMNLECRGTGCNDSLFEVSTGVTKQ